MKDFKEFISEKTQDNEIMTSLNESLKSVLTPEEEEIIDQKINEFVLEYLNKGKDLGDLSEEITNEGFLGSIFGGLTGFALGSSIGKVIAKTLGVEKGVLYDLLTSRLVGAALGAALGNRI